MMLFLAVLSSFMAVSTCFAAGGNPTNGSCGPSDKPEAVLWEFNMSTQTLTISGEGDMADYESPADAPWYSWCSDITTVVVADGVTHVSDRAFSADYWQLSSVSMASSVISIGDYAFNTVPLKSILQPAKSTRSGGEEPVASVLPDDLQSIGIHALSGMQITSLTIPANVNFIGEGALSYNENLTTLTFLGTMTIPWFEGDILEGCDALTAIYVPEAAMDDYKNADCWQQYTSFVQAAPEQGDEPGGGGEEESVPGTITIGKAQYGHDLPITAQYKYALSQQVFSASEINHGKGKIWSLAFNTEKGDLTRNLTVYVTHTDQSSMSSSSWQPVTEADCYFSGEVMFTSGQWNIIYFDKPFEYDGKSNIVVTVDDNTGKSSGGWGVLSNYIFYGDGNCVVARDKNNDIDPLDATSIENASQKDSYSYKSQIQFTFGDYPTPGNPAVTDIGDVSANVQCSLRGEATAWNVRYRKVAKEGEEEQRYVAVSDLTTRSYTIEGLDPATKYEVQLQAVFGEDNLSAWSDPLVFVTACCPVEEQAEIIYAVNSNYSSWYNYAIQFVDITDENNPVEVAYVNPIDYDFTGGTLTLCCGHKYRVNWIYDEEHSNVNHQFRLALYFEPGDLFYSMARGEAPEQTAELTTFVMDCTPYCAQMPQALSVTGTTYESAVISFRSQTKSGQVVYSTEADFDPEKATPEDVDFEELPQSEDPWGGVPANASVTLKGLQPLTAYYVSVRSICTAEPIGKSRWSKPVKVTTGSRYDGPSGLVAEPINSSSEKLTWQNGGANSKSNIYYRAKVEGDPVNVDDIETLGGGNGKGFSNGGWGEGIWNSGGTSPFSNILYVGNVPGSNTYSFQAGQGKTGKSAEKFLYGMVEQTEATPLEQMRKLDRECLNDADRAARIRSIKSEIDEINKELYELGNRLSNGEITQEEYDKHKAELEKELSEKQSEVETLESLPTDEEKLKKMKELEGYIESKEKMMDDLFEMVQRGEIGDEQYTEEIKSLNEDYYKLKKELSNLRATTSAADNVEKDGFSITHEVPSGVDTQHNSPKSRALTRADEDAKYVFFIRHSNDDGVLLIKDLTITPNEKLNEWTVIPNVSGTSYTLTGLDPNTTYEVMVEAVSDAGMAGSRSPIASFTTIGEEADPTEGVFSVGKEKKVSFARGNLRYNGDGWEGTWSMAAQQYDVMGEQNINARTDEEGNVTNSEPANFKDLLCWSTSKNRYGVSNYYYMEESEAAQYFQGDFADWGSIPALISDLGSGWSTLSKDEWNYLLNERENAAQLKLVATVAGVKGLVLIPDEWTAPDGLLLSEEMTAEQWAVIEQTGVVFLPVAGQLTSTYDSSTWKTTTTVNEIGTYWTSTPSGDKSDVNAFVLTIGADGATLDSDLYRRVATAVRLVKEVDAYEIGDANGDGTIDANDIVEIVNFIAGTPSENFKGEKFADVNKDGVVNIADVVMLDNIINRPQE